MQKEISWPTYKKKICNIVCVVENETSCVCVGGAFKANILSFTIMKHAKQRKGQRILRKDER